jgi:hypothetical protein
MRILHASLLMSLTLAVGTHALAQGQAPAPLSKGERIKLCEKKRGVPLNPSDPQPLKIEGNVVKPVLIHQVKPGAAFSGSGGAVVEAVIDEDGCIRQPRIVNATDTGFGRSTVKNLEQWVFEPATLDGRPVRVLYTLTVNSH